MKYLTKEWYKKMQSTGLHILLKVDKRADEFSEKFYQKIYNKEKKKYVKQESAFTNYKKFKKMILKELYNKEELTEEKILGEFEQYKKDTFEGRSIEENFDYNQNLMIEFLKSSIPSDILNKVKDIRVLALNYVSLEVYNLLKEYCEENENYVENVLKEYTHKESEQLKNETNEFFENSFHDSFILEVNKNKKDLIIKLDPDFTDKNIITFKNYNIILDENIKECVWLYEEIYKIEKGYEIHILTSNYERNELKELIITCEDIIVK